MVKNITAISASGGNPHKDMSVSFSCHVHSSSYLGSICQAFITFFLETNKCLAIAGGKGRKCILGKKGNLIRGEKGEVCLREEEGSLCGSVNEVRKKN